MSTVKEMKKFLKDFPDDYTIYIASDEEGNEYHKPDLKMIGGNNKLKRLYLYPDESTRLEGDDV
jgi:hypothetical protein